MKSEKDLKKEILELHKLIVQGLVKGLSHTHTDGRTDNIDFWRKRSRLFEAFSRSIMNLITEQDNKYEEKELEEIAEEGYNNDT